jgi:hypothetical protein
MWVVDPLNIWINFWQKTGVLWFKYSPTIRAAWKSISAEMQSAFYFSL